MQMGDGECVDSTHKSHTGQVVVRSIYNKLAEANKLSSVNQKNVLAEINFG